MLHRLTQTLLPGGPAARLPILIYHRVLDQPDPLQPWEPDLARFEGQMRTLARLFRVLPLGEAVARLREGTLPAAAACITFDDGYADNLALAHPVLARLGLPATVFVADSYLDGGVMWNDLVIEAIRQTPRDSLDPVFDGMPPVALATQAERALAIERVLGALKYRPPAVRHAEAERVFALSGARTRPSLMMRAQDVSTLARAGIAIGAHTHTHPILAQAGDTDVEREILDNKRRLEALTQAEVRTFAYPNGRPGRDYGPRDVACVRRLGFDLAVSTRPAVATTADDPWQLPRFTPWDRSAWRYGLRLVAVSARTRIPAA